MSWTFAPRANSASGATIEDITHHAIEWPPGQVLERYILESFNSWSVCKRGNDINSDAFFWGKKGISIPSLGSCSTPKLVFKDVFLCGLSVPQISIQQVFSHTYRSCRPGLQLFPKLDPDFLRPITSSVHRRWFSSRALFIRVLHFVIFRARCEARGQAKGKGSGENDAQESSVKLNLQSNGGFEWFLLPRNIIKLDGGI